MVVILSFVNIFFAELGQLTGVAAILRFPIPGLDDEEEDEEPSDSDDSSEDEVKKPTQNGTEE